MENWQSFVTKALIGIKTGQNIIDIFKRKDAPTVDADVLLQFADQFATAEVAIEMLKSELDKKEAEIQKLKEDMTKMPRCKHCGKPAMHLVSFRRHPTFGMLGVQIEKWHCKECGFEEERVPSREKR